MSDEKIYPDPGRPCGPRLGRLGDVRDACTRPRSRTPSSSGASKRRALDWIKPFTRSRTSPSTPNDLHVRWFADGTLNVAANCLDRHLAKRGEQTAILWERDDPADDVRILSYRELHEQVCRLANALKGARRREGRPRHDLHADDSRGRRRDARVRAHRRGALGGLRRLLARGAAKGASRTATRAS